MRLFINIGPRFGRNEAIRGSRRHRVDHGRGNQNHSSLGGPTSRRRMVEVCFYYVILRSFDFITQFEIVKILLCSI